MVSIIYREAELMNWFLPPNKIHFLGQRLDFTWNNNFQKIDRTNTKPINLGSGLLHLFKMAAEGSRKPEPLSTVFTGITFHDLWPGQVSSNDAARFKRLPDICHICYQEVARHLSHLLSSEFANLPYYLLDRI